MNFKVLIFGLICVNFAALVRTEKTVCYFASWAVYREDNGSFDVDDIDPFLCTDLIFLLAGIDDETSTIEVLDPWNENCADDDPAGNNCAYDRFVALKEQNPGLTVTLAVGGSSELAFSDLAADTTKRQIFVNSTMQLIEEHGFDGIELMWEYPVETSGNQDDKENFLLLLHDLRAVFNLQDPPLQLTIVGSGLKGVIDVAYNVTGIVQYVDFIHILSYDYHGAWEDETNHHAPLCGYANDTDDDVYLRVDYPLEYYVELGAPVEKLVLGIALYGRGWTVDDIDDYGVRAPAHNPSPAGPYTGTEGLLNYNEICGMLLLDICGSFNDENLQEPYLFCTDDNTWCGYDDADSAYEKARYAKNRGAAGVSVWSMDGEDFLPACSPTANPIITSVNAALAQPPDEDPFECPPLGWS